jgi:hypothetical protein
MRAYSSFLLDTTVVTEVSDYNTKFPCDNLELTYSDWK